MMRVVAMIFADHNAIGLEQPRAADQGVDFDALDIKLYDKTSFGQIHAIHQIIQRHHGNGFAVSVLVGDAQ